VEAFLEATAVLTGLLVLYKCVVLLYTGWKRIDNFLDDWNGEPGRPGHEATLSMPERMDQVEARLTALEVTIQNGNGKEH
jgi:hypothetical protein